MNNEQRFQKNLTYIFVVGYFGLIFAFLALGFLMVRALIGAMVPDAPDWLTMDLPVWATALIAWLQGVIGTLIGVLTGSVKDQSQYWYGSSLGSKLKDRPPAPQPRGN